MCGIGGLLLFPKERTNDELRYIRFLTKGILVENQARGSDSAGIVTFQNDCVHKLIKNHMPASEFVATQAVEDFMLLNINRDTQNILLHTRASTKGSPNDNHNNHPIETYSCIGVHNGMIRNDDALFKDFHLPRQGQVDSEVIFRLVDVLGVELSREKVSTVAECLQGVFTFAFCRKDTPSEMYIVRKDNPITMVYIPELAVIAFASMKIYLTKAISQLNVLVKSILGDTIEEPYIDLDACIFFEPKSTSVYVFDTSLTNPLEQMNQEPVSFTSAYGNVSYAYGYSDYELDEYYGYQYRPPVATQITSETRNPSYDLISQSVNGVPFRSLLTKLSESELCQFEDELAIVKSLAWSEGFKKAHEKTADEIQMLEQTAHDKGHSEGYKACLEDLKKSIQESREAKKSLLV